MTKITKKHAAGGFLALIFIAAITYLIWRAIDKHHEPPPPPPPSKPTVKSVKGANMKITIDQIQDKNS
tara:strand:- start:252 stop:455 length:204 start_codon:yes stop_codon:yes gene_type:complete